MLKGMKANLPEIISKGGKIALLVFLFWVASVIPKISKIIKINMKTKMRE